MPETTYLPNGYQTTTKQKPPYRLIVQIIQEPSHDRTLTEIETYKSFDEAIKDARQLYILHRTQSRLQLATPIDVVICNCDGDNMYVASHDKLLTQ